MASTKTTGKFTTATLTGSAQHMRQGASHRTYLTMFNANMPVVGLQDHQPIILLGPKGERKETVESTWYDETMTVPSTGSIAYDLPEGRVEWVPNFKKKPETYLGVPKLFKDNEIYEDMPKFDGVKYIQDAGASMIYPLILANVSMKDPYQMDGVIEPLTIRDEISFSVLHLMHEHPHQVRGNFESGVTTARGEDIQIQQMFYPGQEISHLPWEDPTEQMGNSTGSDGNIIINGFVADGRTIVKIFKDQHEVDAKMDLAGLTRPFTDTTNSNVGIISAVRAMKPPTGDLLQPGQVSSGAGLTYSLRGGLGVGTDSLAFGGRGN